MLPETSRTYRVKIVVTMAIEPGKELVLGRCHSCEAVRCRYYRAKFDPRPPQL